MCPGLYQTQVTVGDQTFGPRKSSTKKMARKLVAIVALKVLMDWEPAEGCVCLPCMCIFYVILLFFILFYQEHPI